MIWSAQGVPDKDEEQTRKVLDKQLSSTNPVFVITLRDTGEVLGCGGCSMRKGCTGWPEVGYTLKKQVWGKGYATEFLEGFLGFWWGLERELVGGLEVDTKTVFRGQQEGETVEECVAALALAEHKASRRVMEKCGMKLVKTWEEKDLRDPTKMAELCVYVLKKPTVKTA